jgi:xanthine dehydrogenase accessory factor
MNHWQEAAELLRRLAALLAAGERAALATVVRVQGSAYRRPGARLLVEQAGESAGGVSGGCLEADVREVARAILAGAPPRLLAYDTSAGDEEVFGLGLGCRGRVEVFVQPATEGPLVRLVEEWRTQLAGDAPFAVATVVGGASGQGAMLLLTADGSRRGSLDDDGPGGSHGDSATPRPLAAGLDATVREHASAALAAGRSGCVEAAGHMVFVESLSPPPHLLVCGAGDDAVPLVALAAEAGFRVTVVDHRAALLSAERFPSAARRAVARASDDDLALPPAERTFAVVMTHSFAHDRDWARRLLAAGAPHVGLLGPRVRAGEIRKGLGVPEQDGRLFGPVGLDLGADGPRQVAVSIVAELLAVVSGRTPRRLCERQESIHAG